MCVAEFDFRVAVYRALLSALEEHFEGDLTKSEYLPLVLYVEHTDAWRTGASQYYSITIAESKQLLGRLYAKGAPWPDAEWDPSNGEHLLP